MKTKLKWVIRNYLQCIFCIRLVSLSLKEVEMTYEKMGRNTLSDLELVLTVVFVCLLVCLFVYLKNLEIPKEMSSCYV